MRAELGWQRRAPQILTYVLIALILIFLYLIFMAGQFHGLTDENAMDYAQLAQNLAQGEGFTTNFIKPISLTRNASLARHPDLTYPPIHPWFTSLVMRAVGTNDRAAALASGIPFLLTVPLVFVLTSWIFDRRTAWLATVLHFTNFEILHYAISGLEVCLLSLWLLMLFMVLYQYARRADLQPALAGAVGLLIGLIYLTKYIWVVALIPVLIYLYYSTEDHTRVRTLLVVVIVFAVVISPWCYRTYQVSGNPFFTWRWYEVVMNTRTNPGMTLYRSLPEEVPNPVTYALIHPMEIYEKLRAGVVNLYKVPARIAGFYATPLFIVAILVPLSTEKFEKLRYLLYGMLVLIIVSLLFVAAASRLLYPVAPLLTVVAAAFFFRILLPVVQDYVSPLRRRYTALGIAVLMLLHTTPLLFALTIRHRPGDRPPIQQSQDWAAQVKELGGSPIITDQPWLLAWHSDMTVVWLPKTGADLKRIQQQVGQLPWMLLTPAVTRNQTTERTEEWAQLWRQAVAREVAPYYGFVVSKRIAGGTWVLLRKNPQADPVAPAESALPAANTLQPSE